MRTTIVLSGLALIALALAGCTGRFETEQTEPFRVEVIEVDGDSKEARVDAGDGGTQGAKKEFRIANTQNVTQVTVIVQVTPAAMTPPPPETNETNVTPPNATTTVVLIIVEDRDTGERLAERTVETEAEAQTAELNINVKGKDNVVVVTQAQQGSADVNVSARGGEAFQDGNMTAPQP